MLPSEIDEVSSSDYDLLERYWHEEPWGSYRDNLHTAIIAREVHRSAFGSKSTATIKDFLLRLPETVKEKRSNFFNMFRMLAGGVKTKVAKVAKR